MLYEVITPFKTVHGWHIVQVEDRRDQSNSEEAIQNRAYQILFNRRFAEEAQTWMDELRDEAFIQIENGNSN